MSILGTPDACRMVPSLWLHLINICWGLDRSRATSGSELLMEGNRACTPRRQGHQMCKRRLSVMA